MRLLFVWLRDHDARIRLVGRLGATEPERNSGRYQAEFEYASAWLKEGFPLDPESLPLGATRSRFGSEQFYPPLAVFDDALPDEWGRSLLTISIRQEGLEPTPMEMLMRMRGGGTGALLFTATAEPPAPADTVHSTALSDLLDAAEKFESGNLPPGGEFQKLLEGGSRAGGARPKALVHDDKGEWLVKFPSRGDGGCDAVGLEATCLSLAQQAGLHVPEFRLQTIGSRRVLMVRRFDITSRNGRLHMISLSTLCRERPGIYMHDYSALARAVRKHSAAPTNDVAALFRQMVFNAAIGNVDDHLKNFWMVAQDSSYRLSPAFDLVPDITGRGSHALHFQYDSTSPSRAGLRAVAQAWGVADADSIIDQVAASVDNFAAAAESLAVVKNQILQTITADIQTRVRRISS